MDVIESLGDELRIDGHRYELWIRRDEWFLYRGEFNGTSFRHFVILKAEAIPRPDKS
jgi:hypothetical protein